MIVLDSIAALLGCLPISHLSHATNHWQYDYSEPCYKKVCIYLSNLGKLKNINKLLERLYVLSKNKYCQNLIPFYTNSNYTYHVEHGSTNSGGK
jgi:hypothetical protein